MNCPCGLAKTYEDCCGVFHRGDAEAPSAELLMRSRYSAFAMKNGEYLRETTDPQTTHLFDHEAQDKWAEQATFSRLEILKAVENGNKATVEFKAHYRMDDQDHVHHEVSKFRQQAGSWYFRQGAEVKS
ncbi:MAG: hypothetical protein KF789_06730 [Bdellovibrionaceae bacterium]|nr:hypothetical protein [Pseudobdellovibrionaceae bacterium]